MGDYPHKGSHSHFSGYIRRPQKAHDAQGNWFKILDSKLSNNFENFLLGVQGIIGKEFKLIRVELENIIGCWDVSWRICNWDCKFLSITSGLFWSLDNSDGRSVSKV